MADLKSFTILVIDDDPSVRATVCLILASSGFCVLEAANAREAKEIWKARMDDIDLLLCDIMLPGVQGPDLVRDLFVNPPLVPVVFATGVGSAQAAELTKNILHADVLQKPFTAGELIEKIEIHREKQSWSQEAA